MKKTKAPPSPLDLLFMLADSCMHKVSPEAWKVISYVAVQHIRVYPEYLERLKSPLARQWNLDVESRGMINILPDASDGNERPYRPWNGPGRPKPTVVREVLCSVSSKYVTAFAPNVGGATMEQAWAEPQLTRPSKRPRQLEFWFANAGTSKAKMWRVCTGSNGTASKNWTGSGRRILASQRNPQNRCPPCGQVPRVRTPSHVKRAPRTWAVM